MHYLRVVIPSHPPRIHSHPPSKSGLALSGKGSVGTVTVINYLNYSTPHQKAVVIAVLALRRSFTFTIRSSTSSSSSILTLTTSISSQNIVVGSWRRLVHQNEFIRFRRLRE